MFRFCPKFFGRKKRSQQNMRTCDSRRRPVEASKWQIFSTILILSDALPKKKLFQIFGLNEEKSHNSQPPLQCFGTKPLLQPQPKHHPRQRPPTAMPPKTQGESLTLFQSPEILLAYWMNSKISVPISSQSVRCMI